MAWPVCAVFMLAITGQAFAENAGKSDQIHEGNPSTSQEPELENSAKMVDFSVSEEELSEELYEEALPNLDETTIQEWEGGVKDSYHLQAYTANTTGTDLAVLNLRAPNNTEPFPNMTSVQSSADIVNRGSTQITGFHYSVYMDGNLMTSKAVSVTMNPNNAVTLNLNFTSKVGGTHTVLVSVWLPDGVTETNTANNTVSRSFRWEDCVSLRVLSLESPEGDALESNKNHEFEARIANLGTLNAYQVPVYILNGVKTLGYQTIDFPAGKIANLSIQLIFDRKQDVNLGIVVDPNQVSGDIDPSDNSAARMIEITYDLEDWAGRWEDASQLEVQIHPSALEYCEQDYAISSSQFTKAIQAWNGISREVSFDKVRHSTSTMDEDYMMDGVELHVYAYEKMHTNTLGYTEVYKEGLFGEPTQVTDLSGDDSNYVQAKIYLNTATFMNQSEKGQMKTITHEFGHALGLAHPTCGDKAIMWKTKDSDYVSHEITEHDEYNMIHKYEK